MKSLSIASFLSAFLVTSAAASDIIYVIERNMSTCIGNATLIKAQENNLAVGCIGYTQDKPNAYIFNFYVVPQYRKNGLGTNLLKLAIHDIAAQSKYTNIELDAKPSSDSPFNLEQLIKYYNKFGFQVTTNYGFKAHMIGSLPPHIPPVRSSNDMFDDVLATFSPK